MAIRKRRGKTGLSYSVLILFLSFLIMGTGIRRATAVEYFDFSRRISMDFKDVSLKDALKVLSQQSGMNFVAAKDVENVTFTLYLDDVTVKEALDKLLDANNLIYNLDPQSNIFVVRRSSAPEIETTTRVFYLKYARVPGSRLDSEILRGTFSATTSLSSGGSATGGISGGSATGGISGYGATGGISGYGATGGSSAGVTGASRGGILTVVKNLLTEHGKVDADLRTNSLVVTDIPEKMPIIEEVIVKLDKPLPQVMIEAEMLDVDKSSVDKLGVAFGQQFLSLSGSNVVSKFPFWGQDFEKGKSAPFTADTNSTEFSYGKLDATTFSAVFNFLITDTSTKFLARPRILTLSNETAEIKIVTNEAIGLTTNTASNQGGTGSVTEQAERSETGVSLRVTPQIEEESGDITMFIQPMVAEAKTGGTFGSQAFKDPEIRTTKSTVRMKDGETLVVGGLIRTKTDDTHKRLPFFSRIPILGVLFRDKDRTEQERELVVFITPHILKEGQSEVAGAFGPQGLARDLDREQDLSQDESEIERVLKEYEQGM
ncbi:MAG: secretin N-terminal domain-containing protein [Candidatus Omnitrophota bacterium]